jgi:outer membrane protein assembly factor BamB
MIKTFHCPACHASLDLPETLTQPAVKCPYCNTTVIVPEDLRHSGGGQAATVETDQIIQELLRLIQSGKKIEAIKTYHEFFKVDLKSAKDGVDALELGQMGEMETTIVYTPTSKSAGCAGGAFITMTILLLMIGGAAAFLFFFLVPSESGVSGAISSFSQEISQAASNTQVSGPTVLLPLGDGQPAEVAYLLRDFTREEFRVGFMRGGTELWRSDPVRGQSSGHSLFGDEQTVYHVVENELTALGRENGRLLWKTTLSDRLPYTCEGCVLAYGDTLVVQTLDNNLIGLNSATGEQRWQARLDLNAPSGLHRLGSWVGVMTYDSQRNGGMDLIEPATGQITRRLEPRCPHPSFDPQDPSLTDPIAVDENQQSVHFIFGFFTPKCVQRWDYANGSEVWSSFIEDSLPSTDPAIVQDSNHIYYNTGNSQIYAAAKADGALSLLAQEPGYKLIPLAARNNILLLQATRTQGSQRDELWGVDAANGGVLWKVVPQENEMLTMSGVNVVRADDGYWFAQPTLSNVYLLQARHDPPRLVMETLGLRDGVSGGQQTLPLPASSSSYWLDLVGWDNDQAWLLINLRQIWAVDPTSAQTVYRGP